MRPASKRFFIHSCIYRRILIISYLATSRGTNSLSMLMCRRAVNQSINLREVIMIRDSSLTSSGLLSSDELNDAISHVCMS